MIPLGYKCGDTRFLERGGEDYLVIFDELTNLSMNNYLFAKHFETRKANTVIEYRKEYIKKENYAKIKKENESLISCHKVIARSSEAAGHRIKYTNMMHYHSLNFDWATNCNPDNIRNIIVHLLKKKLNDPVDNTSWTSPNTNVTYRWDEYFLIV